MTRRSGILLHPSSLPGGKFNGELGQHAYRFIDFLEAADQKIWQILPLVPTHNDFSPYQGLSVHAGNPLLICPVELVNRDWLSPTDLEAFSNIENTFEYKHAIIRTTFQTFINNAPESDKKEFDVFKKQHAFWLSDYALYVQLKGFFKDDHWTHWPADFKNRTSSTLELHQQQHEEEIETIKFEQFVFFGQWHSLKQYANNKGILIYGDIPIFIAHDSAEVWANRQLFLLNDEGEPQVVAGVPPDYFSETGQRWGNPLYDWQALESTNYQWWIERISTQLELFDQLRIDHFRGFESYWVIPADEPTAVKGHWEKGPGAKLFECFQQQFGEHLPLIAEDLGLITEEVHALRLQFGLPGMKILHFAFDGDPNNPYLPNHHEVNSVVYTGTHDNNTTLGWFHELNDQQKQEVDQYSLGHADEMPWPLIELAVSSTADTCIFPMQDILELDGMHRMNTPGTTTGNWQWRFEWDWIKEDLATRLRKLCETYIR